MWSNLKSVFVLGLVAVSYASPIAQPDTNVVEGRSPSVLVARAKVPDTIDCQGQKFSSDDIKAAMKESKTPHGKYPEKFGNKSGSSKVFDNIPDSTQLWEQPLADPTWTGNGSPGKYRVVMKNDYSYAGVMIESAGGAFTKC